MTALVLYASLALASTYKPGSVGYLYDSCVAALKDSQTADAFDATYCGGFVEGYVTGVAATNIHLPPPSPDDPCAAKKTIEFARLNNRFCANLPDYKNLSLTDINSIAPTAANIFFRWIDFLKTQKGDAALNAPVTAHLNDMIGKGHFCDQLPKTLSDKSNPTIGPALQKLNLVKYIELQRSKTVSSEYAACAANYKAGAFNASRCGAEITGFITGALSMRDMPIKIQKPGDSCGKEIARLRKDLDPTKTMCVSKDVNSAVVAKIFLEKIDGAKTNAAPGYGAAGFQPIYFGLLCAKK